MSHTRDVSICDVAADRSSLDWLSHLDLSFLELAFVFFALGGMINSVFATDLVVDAVRAYHFKNGVDRYEMQFKASFNIEKNFTYYVQIFAAPHNGRPVILGGGFEQISWKEPDDRQMLIDTFRHSDNPNNFLIAYESEELKAAYLKNSALVGKPQRVDVQDLMTAFRPGSIVNAVDTSQTEVPISFSGEHISRYSESRGVR